MRNRRPKTTEERRHWFHMMDSITIRAQGRHDDIGCATPDGRVLVLQLAAEIPGTAPAGVVLL